MPRSWPGGSSTLGRRCSRRATSSSPATRSRYRRRLRLARAVRPDVRPGPSRRGLRRRRRCGHPHDRIALTRANEQAEALVDEINRLAARSHAGRPGAARRGRRPGPVRAPGRRRASQRISDRAGLGRRRGPDAPAARPRQGRTPTARVGGYAAEPGSRLRGSAGLSDELSLLRPGHRRLGPAGGPAAARHGGPQRRQREHARLLAPGASRSSSRRRTRCPAFNRSGLPGQIGSGVSVAAITRVRDNFLDRQVQAQTALQGEWDTRQQELAKVEAIFPEPSDSGLGQRHQQVLDAWQDVAADPTSTAARTALTEQAASLAMQLNSDSTQLGMISAGIDSQVSQQITTINDLATQIASLNGQIQRVTVTGDHAQRPAGPARAAARAAERHRPDHGHDPDRRHDDRPGRRHGPGLRRHARQLVASTDPATGHVTPTWADGSAVTLPSGADEGAAGRPGRGPRRLPVPARRAGPGHRRLHQRAPRARRRRQRQRGPGDLHLPRGQRGRHAGGQPGRGRRPATGRRGCLAEHPRRRLGGRPDRRPAERQELLGGRCRHGRGRRHGPDDGHAPPA